MEKEFKFFAEPATFRPKLHLFGRNWLVRQKLAGSADGSVRLLWFGDFAVQNFGFCRNWKIRFGRTLFDMIGSTGMTMLYPKKSSQLPLVWAHGRAARHGGSPPSRRLCVFEYGRYFSHLLSDLEDIGDFVRAPCPL